MMTTMVERETGKIEIFRERERTEKKWKGRRKEEEKGGFPYWYKLCERSERRRRQSVSPCET